MRRQETKAKRKIERYRREGGEQKRQDGNTAGRKGHAQCGVKAQLQGRRHSGDRDMAGPGSMRKTAFGRRHRKERVRLREGKNKTEKNESGRGWMMNIATAGNGLNCLPGSAKMYSLWIWNHQQKICICNILCTLFKLMENHWILIEDFSPWNMP